jgi:hypothetical protein
LLINPPVTYSDNQIYFWDSNPEDENIYTQPGLLIAANFVAQGQSAKVVADKHCYS